MNYNHHLALPVFCHSFQIIQDNKNQKNYYCSIFHIAHVKSFHLGILSPEKGWRQAKNVRVSTVNDPKAIVVIINIQLTITKTRT